ncbi:hypothetical protein ACI2JW_04310 [Serratia ureilytica]|uniref:hypothetical protein n=1 Tax=Serratia ureilytica TaxID=300181 RepID=UPI00384C8FA1
MDNKLRELSKPVFEIEISDGYWLNCSISPLQPRDGAKFNGWPDGVNRLYSQEYVSALIQRAERLDSMLTESVQALKETEQKSAELEQAMRHIHGALLDITVPRVAIAKAAELAVEHANMKEQSNG